MSYLKQPSSVPGDKLSPPGFIALCDLLTSASDKDRVFSQPDRAKDQLDKPYWRNLPAIPEMLRVIKPEIMSLERQPIATTDTPFTTKSHLTDMANDIDALLSEREKLLDWQEEQINWEGEMNMSCPHCHKGGFHHVKVWQRHLNKHKPCPVPACEERADNLQALIKHIEQHPQTDQQALKRRLYEVKDKTVGIEGADNKILRKLADLTCWHRVDKGFCGKIFSRSALLKVHLRTHTGEKPHKCQQCGKMFNQTGILERHLKKQKPCQWPCPVSTCEQRADSLQALIKHIKQHPQTDQQTLKSRLYEVKDKTVGIEGADNKILRKLADLTCRHRVDKGFCGKICRCSAELEEHIRTHTGEKLHKSQQGGKVFKKRGIKKHQIIHTIQRTLKCQYCEKMFKRKTHLDTHLRLHTNRADYECQECGKKFNQKVHLKTHVRIHTGEMPFECEQCKRKFKFSSSLKSHLLTHQRSDECALFGDKFNQKGKLKKHLRKHKNSTTTGSRGCRKS